MDDVNDNKADNFIRTFRIKIEKYCMQNSTARSTFQFQIYKPEPKEDDVTVPFRFSFFDLTSTICACKCYTLNLKFTHFPNQYTKRWNGILMYFVKYVLDLHW